MEQKEIRKLLALEDSNWWLKARRNLLLELMPENIKSVFEAGAGTGKTLEMLKEKGFSAEGIEPDRKAVDYAGKKGIKLINSSLENFYFTKKYDLILLMDVLEHIKDDSTALKKISGAVKEKSFIFITVPAFNFLFSPHDRLMHHFRRYNKKEIKFLLESNGFEIMNISYWNFFLFIPSALLKLFKKFFYKNFPEAESDLSELPEPFNSVLYFVLKSENYFISKGLSFPFGTSIACLAKKK